MSRSLWRTLLSLLAVAAVLGLAACGGDEESADEGSGGTPATTEPGASGNVTEELFKGTAADNIANPEEGGKKGGKITMLNAGDVTYIDPGTSYYSVDWAVFSAVHRNLYSYTPQDPTKPVPDLAETEPQISEDGKTVTVKIREGVMFSEPVNREVTSADVKYAIERGFSANVNNGYARVYMGDIVGAPVEQGDYVEIPGIETPDKYTIVFKLKKTTSGGLLGALSLPISAPVPKEYAQKYDRQNPSTYGEYAVFTGPYKFDADASGKVQGVGYQPGKRIRLVRNPEYVDVGDFRPAYVDEWEISIGNEDSGVAARRVLTGENLVMGDIEPPASQLKRLLQDNKTELSAVSGGGWRMISMDNSRPPFDDLDVRKATIAGFDRVAARQQRGGEAIGPIAQHFIPPGMPGFDESGGIEGFPEFDWLAKPDGDRALSAEYFKKAGYASGKYEGNETVLIVGDGAEPDRSIAQITEQQLNEMGFKTQLRLLERASMFTRFCNAPKSDATVCPSVGWQKDFADAQSMLDPTFSGSAIIESGNSNWPEIDNPEINQAINQAKLVTDPDERAQAWADANKLIVGQAPSISYMWDYQTTAASPNVRGVQNAYTTLWDFNYTSLR
jgi:peptide/nickel transport system substrate-binding protein